MKDLYTVTVAAHALRELLAWLQENPNWQALDLERDGEADDLADLDELWGDAETTLRDAGLEELARKVRGIESTEGIREIYLATLAELGSLVLDRWVEDNLPDGQPKTLFTIIRISRY